MPRKIPAKKEPKKPQKYQRPIWLTKKQIDLLDRVAVVEDSSRQKIMAIAISKYLNKKYNELYGGDAPRD